MKTGPWLKVSSDSVGAGDQTLGPWVQQLPKYLDVLKEITKILIFFKNW